MFLNVEGLIGKSGNFYTECEKYEPDIFCFTETWHTKKPLAKFFERYTIHETYGIREGTKGRFKWGIIIGIKPEIQGNIVFKNDHIYLIRLKKFLLVLSYIPPSLECDVIDRIFEIIKTYKTPNENIVIMGDLNSRIGHFENFEISERKSMDSVINKRGRKLIENIVDFDLEVLNGCTVSDSNGSSTFINDRGSSVIDLCMVSKKLIIHVNDFEVLDSLESSHLPILLTIYKENTYDDNDDVPPKLIKRIIWNPSNYEIFSQTLNIKLQETNDTSFESILKVVYETAEECNILKHKNLSVDNRFKEYGPSWFYSECKQLKRISIMKLRRYKAQRKNNHRNTDLARIDFIKSKTLYKNKVKECKSNFNNAIFDMLRNSKNAKDFYYAIRLYRNKGRSDPQAKIPITVFKSFFASVFELNEVECLSNREIDQANDIDSEDEIDKDFSLEELKGAVKRLSKGKAPGSDGIPNEVWKAFPENNELKLLEMLNTCLKNKAFPESWSEIVIVPIYKKNDKNLPENYRPVSLANTILKLFTSMISKRLLEWSKNKNIISEYQAAYKPNTGCSDHVFVLNAAIQSNLAKKRKLYALFVDMSQAFDTVNHKRLWEKLKAKGLSTNMIDVIKEIYSKAKAKIRTTYDISDSFPIETGVLQGETMSSTLFNIYMEDLIKLMDESNSIPIKVLRAKIHTLLYADDIIILAYSLKELQKKINVLFNFCNSHGLKVNLNKTKYMIFGKKHDKSKNTPTYGNISIERVKEYVYLGVTFTEVPNFYNAKISFFNKVKNASAQLHSLIYRSKMNKFESHLTLFNSLVRSTLIYCASIWGLKYLHEFENFRIRFLKRLFLLPKVAPAWFLRLELETGNSEIFFLKQIVKFWLRIILLDKKSLVYKCYEALKYTHSNTYNWYRDLKTILTKWNLETLLDLENNEGLEYKIAIKEVNIQIARAQSKSVSIDIEAMMKSKLLNLYSKNKTHVIKENYLSQNCTWQAKQLIMQLKLGISHLTYKGKKIGANKLEFMYKNINSPKCDLCGKEDEDTFHLMFQCPHYASIRNRYSMCTSNNSYDRTNYLKMFNNLSESDVVKFYLFFNDIFRTRELYIFNMIFS